MTPVMPTLVTEWFVCKVGILNEFHQLPRRFWVTDFHHKADIFDFHLFDGWIEQHIQHSIWILSMMNSVLQP